MEQAKRPHFPLKMTSKKHMEGKPQDFFVKVYGDGSYSTPETWWTVLGGIGAAVADWNDLEEDVVHRRKWDMKEAIVGQTGSSSLKLGFACWSLQMWRIPRRGFLRHRRRAQALHNSRPQSMQCKSNGLRWHQKHTRRSSMT